MILNGIENSFLHSLNLLLEHTGLSKAEALQLQRRQAKLNLIRTHEEIANRYNLRTRQIEFKNGDFILLILHTK